MIYPFCPKEQKLKKQKKLQPTCSLKRVCYTHKKFKTTKNYRVAKKMQKDNFEKCFFKLINNAVFGKTKEIVGKKIEISSL